MKESVIGGIVIAALFTTNTASARSASVVSPTAQATHSRGSFFTSNQNRSDLPGHVERTFKGLDLNHDGFVTRDEIATAKARFEERMSSATPKRAQRMFARLDTDGDGKITQAELDAAHSARRAASGKPVKAPRHASRSSLFVRADANKDGIITHAEFDASVASGKIKLRHANMRGSAIVREFDSADANKDGRISLEEAQQAALRQFDVADSNHDGVVTPDERRQANRAEHGKRRTAT